MRWLRRLDQWWMEPLSPYPLALFRIVVGAFALGYLIFWWPSMVSNAGFEPTQFEPAGIVSVLTEPLASWAVHPLLIGALITGIAFTLGWRYTLTAPTFALLLLWDLTYRNSWGQIFHTENLLVLHIIVLALSPAADAMSLDARRRSNNPSSGLIYGWPLRLCA
ncbi:MAG: hypothetical protein ACOC9Y_09385, partial [Chloroflexota bacterium]